MFHDHVSSRESLFVFFEFDEARGADTDTHVERVLCESESHGLMRHGVCM